MLEADEERGACGRFPYIVSIRDKSNDHKCAGVLIHHRWVLTSAQCVDPGVQADAVVSPQSLTVVVGGCNLKDELPAKNAEGQKVEVFELNNFFVHENWTGSYENGSDIALLLLNGSSKHVPLAMPQGIKGLFATDRVYFVGWGRDEAGRLAEDLRVDGDIHIVDNRFCDGDDAWPFLKDSMVCALGVNRPPDLCAGNIVMP
ncbi:unnamed protein product [Ostreobium quekettii]|uniref:Peptidase S1 domain-containing protein n=1 Tax=Ostreobium quekettii TaxID=121088 RepID=A0A8S1J9J4_9CHLO|nr:unnamed protein product [Ostreobium quekettii]